MRVVYVCTYEACRRRNGYAPKETKEFDTEWEAVKFKEEMLRNWWCSAAWVEAKTVGKDPMENYRPARQAAETVHRMMHKSNWRNPLS